MLFSTTYGSFLLILNFLKKRQLFWKKCGCYARSVNFKFVEQSGTKWIDLEKWTKLPMLGRYSYWFCPNCFSLLIVLYSDPIPHSENGEIYPLIVLKSLLSPAPFEKRKGGIKTGLVRSCSDWKKAYISESIEHGNLSLKCC